MLFVAGWTQMTMCCRCGACHAMLECHGQDLTISIWQKVAGSAVSMSTAAMLQYAEGGMLHVNVVHKTPGGLDAPGAAAGYACSERKLLVILF